MKEISFKIVDQGTDGEFHNSIRSIGSMKFLYSSSLTILSSYFFYISKIREGIDVWISNDNDITTSTTITSKRSSFGNSSLTPPRDDTITTISSSEFDIYCIDKHNLIL